MRYSPFTLDEHTFHQLLISREGREFADKFLTYKEAFDKANFFELFTEEMIEKAVCKEFDKEDRSGEQLLMSIYGQKTLKGDAHLMRNILAYFFYARWGNYKNIGAKLGIPETTLRNRLNWFSRSAEKNLKVQKRITKICKSLVKAGGKKLIKSK